MKRIVAFALAVAALAVPVAQAGAAQSASQPTLAQFKALQRQVTTLQSQVKTLQAQMKVQQKWVPPACTAQTCASISNLTSALDASFALFVCNEAVIADEFQATWQVNDQLSAAVQAGKTYFGPQTSISDAGACASLRITRPAVIPPTVAVFSSIVSLLAG
jgi:hypothetical protein